ncbi:MAG: helix-turn-helix domain-containing protein [Pseudomonadota bacterium]
MHTLLRDLGFRTEQETAEIYDVSIRTLRNWRSRQIGPAWVKRARDVVYREDDIRTDLENRRRIPRNSLHTRGNPHADKRIVD